MNVTPPIDWSDPESVADLTDALTARLVARLDTLARDEAARLGGGARPLLTIRAAMRHAAVGLWDADAPLTAARLLADDPLTPVWLTAATGTGEAGGPAAAIPDLHAAIRAQAAADRLGRPVPLTLGEAGLTVMVAPWAAGREQGVDAHVPSDRRPFDGAGD